MKDVQILIPSDWDNNQRGDYFEKIVADLLRKMGYHVTQRVRVTGMEIDCLGKHQNTGELIYVECKFLKEPFKADIISKMIGNALMRDADSAFLFSSSEPGKDAKGVLEDLHQNDKKVPKAQLRVAFIGPEDLVDLYTDVHSLNEPNTYLNTLPDAIQGTFGSITLAIAPEEVCWVLQQKRGGVPERAYIIPAKDLSDKVHDFDTIKKLIDDNKLWVGLSLENGIGHLSQDTTQDTSNPTPRDPVATVPSADKFEDYRPARTEDFVGRVSLVKEIFDFLGLVRNSSTPTRLLALYGPSGFGKSSIVLYLTSKCRTPRRKNQFYVYPIDTRSAVSPLFIVEAVKAGFRQAMQDKFLSTEYNDVSIDNTENPFSSPSMKSCLGFLEANQRVLVLFFDQFEELFVKESLYETFEAFRRLSYVVEELQSNIVLGFSWRTGISIPDSHPAHHIWHELRDRRAEFGLGPFSASEAAEMVNTLEKVSEKIENPLKRHLIEQSQSLPWLLKKLCIHVFRKLQSGVSQRELVGSQLDARTLFAEDTQDLQGNEIKCLKYIAGNSPADIVDVNEQFGPEIPDRLYGNRLVIKSGHRYTVYWDIFREFLISGEVPAIPITYIPQSQLSTALNVLRFVRSRESTRLDGICKGFNYTIKTVWNIVGDLSAFFLIERVTPDTIKIADDLRTEDDIDIATHLSEDLSQHIVYIYLKNRVQAGQELSMQEVESIFAEAYQSHNLNTLHVYANRLLPWLNFSGLIEIENDCLIRPLTEGRGKRKGKVEHRRSILSGGKPVFVCSASPRRVVELAHRLCVRGELTRTEVEHTSNRNAALDLKALELADWNKKKLRPINDLKQITSDVKSEPDIWNACYELIKERALASTFLNLMADELGKSESASEDYLHTAIKKALNREWQPESAVRYINAGKSWLGYFRQLPKIKGQQSLFDNDF